MVLFYLVAYLFGNMGAFLVVEAVARSEQSEDRRLSRPGPALAGAGAAMLLFLLSLGGIPFVAGFWAKLYIFLAGYRADGERPAAVEHVVDVEVHAQTVAAEIEALDARRSSWFRL